MLQFDYTAIQLNRLPWRRFLKQHNPVATALMVKMKMALRDRPKVKTECLRLLATLKFDPAKSRLIALFIESYLKLTDEENRRYEREPEKLLPEEKVATMELMTSWEKKGAHHGKEELIVRLINRRFGSVSSEVRNGLDKLSADQLDALGEALLDFRTITDLQRWLERTNPQ